MSVSYESYVLQDRGLCHGPIPHPEESFPVCVCVCVCVCAHTCVIKYNSNPLTPMMSR
jgi:hypothetical protein